MKKFNFELELSEVMVLASVLEDLLDQFPDHQQVIDLHDQFKQVVKFEDEVNVHLEIMKTGNFPTGSDKAINEAKKQLCQLIFETGTVDGEVVEYSLYPYNFYYKEDKKWITCFNETHDAFIEEWDTKEEAIEYIGGH